jgi:hypothetical protein
MRGGIFNLGEGIVCCSSLDSEWHDRAGWPTARAYER